MQSYFRFLVAPVCTCSSKQALIVREDVATFSLTFKNKCHFHKKKKVRNSLNSLLGIFLSCTTIIVMLVDHKMYRPVLRIYILIPSFVFIDTISYF